MKNESLFDPAQVLGTSGTSWVKGKETFCGDGIEKCLRKITEKYTKNINTNQTLVENNILKIIFVHCPQFLQISFFCHFFSSKFKYIFQIFTLFYLSFRGFPLKDFLTNNWLPDGVVDNSDFSGIAEYIDSKTVQTWIFFRLPFRTTA